MLFPQYLYISLLTGLLCSFSLFASAAEEAELDKINVTAKPDNTYEADVKGFNATEVDTSGFFNFSKDLNQILNTVPGIITRQKGALGAETELSINGLGGKQIRYFIDGVPMENFGSALDLGDIPINIVKGITVYKGVVPVSLSSDALGGAVNITTPGVTETFFNGAVSYGSFNTQKASLNAQVASTDAHYFARLSGFFNHSDNDYTMRQVAMLDEFGNVIGNKSARRFHNQYTSRMLSLKSGLAARRWADELSLTVTGANNLKQEQHPGTTINQVFGHYHSRNNTLLYSSTYKLSAESYSLTGYLMGGDIQETYFDTASRRYRWDGSYKERDQNLGELNSKSIFRVQDKIVRGNFSGHYHLSKEASLGTSLSVNKIDRSGFDRINKDNPTYSSPNTVEKKVLAIDYSQYWLDKKINSVLFIKRYLYKALSNSQQVVDLNVKNLEKNTNISNNGMGLAIKYQLSDSLNSKFSYEKAYRLPEADEILGNGNFVLPNPDLDVEESNNINLGLLYGHRYGSTYVSLESNVFARNSKGFIQYFASQVIRGKYINLNNVRVRGVELSSELDYDNTYNFKFNITYQDITSQTRRDSEGVLDLNFGSRVPNTPYLFANTRAGWSFFTESFNRFSVYLSSNYVEEYFLNWENSGDKNHKNIIPRQIIHDLETEYVFADGNISTTIVVSNITDEMVFDNFNIQKPGRAYNLKLRYSY